MRRFFFLIDQIFLESEKKGQDHILFFLLLLSRECTFHIFINLRLLPFNECTTNLIDRIPVITRHMIIPHGVQHVIDAILNTHTHSTQTHAHRSSLSRLCFTLPLSTNNQQDREGGRKIKYVFRLLQLSFKKIIIIKKNLAILQERLNTAALQHRHVVEAHTSR